MTLATLITESADLIDESNARYMAGDVVEAQIHLNNLYVVLFDNISLFRSLDEPKPEEPTTPSDTVVPEPGDG